jgi:hypothetical protein
MSAKRNRQVNDLHIEVDEAATLRAARLEHLKDGDGTLFEH